MMETEPYWLDADTATIVQDKEDWLVGPMRFPRRKSPDGLVPEIVMSSDGHKAIRLAVRDGSYAGPLDEQKDEANDRCELRGPSKENIGDPIWYGFSLRIPPDFPVLPERCVVAQVKMPYDDAGNGSPAFSLRVESGRYIATLEHLYEPQDEKEHRFLSATVDGRCGYPAALAYDHHVFNVPVNEREHQVRVLFATSEGPLPPRVARQFSQCSTGVILDAFHPLPSPDGSWVDFMLFVDSSNEKNNDGTIELYADGVIIARAKGEFGFADEAKRKQYFKIGPYRNNAPKVWGPGTAAIEVRDVRRGSSRASIELKNRPDGLTA